ncbi:hypothetical protein HIM_08291 [Hirsutella minnesotensis 3608]|uniref:DUF7702 domain-containing protein n=1 Tax=Hirsutella minnesotensis 3608 TaxID=1043627 RepID=A0A0F7ZMP6_9HYPO|nr:hypothetical protein HIM_08291 [Hirsutella minnesotensis 3608]
MSNAVGQFTYRDGVAVIQLVPFTIFFGLGLVLCVRHGFRRSDGWVIVVTLSLLRILGACFQLATINYPDRAIYGGALICQGIGLAPLTLLNLGLFTRLVVHTVSEHVLTTISLTSIAGIGVAIYGGSKSAESPTLETNDLLKASVLLFLACYLAFACLELIFLRKWRAIPRNEHQLLILFACCAPLMVIRFLYAIIGTFVPSRRRRFGVLTGDVTIFLCMAVLEEIFTVAAYVFVGMRLDKLPPELRKRRPRRKLKLVIRDYFRG